MHTTRSGESNHSVSNGPGPVAVVLVAPTGQGVPARGSIGSTGVPPAGPGAGDHQSLGQCGWRRLSVTRSARWRSTTSAMGDRQMLPVQTKQTLSNPSSSRSERGRSRHRSGRAHRLILPVPTRAPGPTPVPSRGRYAAPTTTGRPPPPARTPREGRMADEQPPQPMGHGIKQRALITMTPKEVDAFIDERRPMTMCTINHDGSIHAVAMWYGFLDGSDRHRDQGQGPKGGQPGTRPPDDLHVRGRRLPTRSCGAWSWWAGPRSSMTPTRCGSWASTCSSGTTAAYTEELRPFVETMLNKRIVARLTVERTVSWDHRKLGLPPTRPPDRELLNGSPMAQPDEPTTSWSPSSP